MPYWTNHNLWAYSGNIYIYISDLQITWDKLTKPQNQVREEYILSIFLFQCGWDFYCNIHPLIFGQIRKFFLLLSCKPNNLMHHKTLKGHGPSIKRAWLGGQGGIYIYTSQLADNKSIKVNFDPSESKWSQLQFSS